MKKSSLNVGQCIWEHKASSITLRPLSLGQLRACCDRLKAIIRYSEIIWVVIAFWIISDISMNFAQVFFELWKSEALIWVRHLVKGRLGRLVGLQWFGLVLAGLASIIYQLLRFTFLVLSEVPLATTIITLFWSLLSTHYEALVWALQFVGKLM